MVYRIYPIEEHRIVCVDISGEQEHKTAAKALAEAVQLARSLGWYRFLMDMQKAVLLDTIADSYRFIEGVAELGFVKTDRFAGLVRQQLDHHFLSETLAVNRGWMVRYFTDREEAIAWLTKWDPA